MESNYEEKYEDSIVPGGKYIRLYDGEDLYGIITFYLDHNKLFSEAHAMLLKPYQSKSNDPRFLFMGKDCIQEAVEFLKKKYEEGLDLAFEVTS